MKKANLSDVAMGQAVGKYQQGDLDGAQREFLKILEYDPKNPDALYFAALVDQQAGRAEVAEHRANDLLLVKPRDGKALNLLGTILMSQGRLDEASGHFTDGIRDDSNNTALHVNLAICQLGLGNTDKSIDHCKSALKIDPDHANAWNIMGNAWLGKSDFERAADAFRAALEKQPGFMDARFNLGKALLEAGKPDAAAEHFEAVIEQAPENVHALTGMADVLVAGHHYSEAEDLYQQALSLNSNFAPAHAGLGKLYRRLGRHNEALACFKPAIELNPNNIEALMFTGEIFRKMGKHEAAAAAFRDVLDIDPDNVQAKFHLATVEESGAPSKPDPDYVRRLFDEFAETFDDSLKTVEYNAPEQLRKLAEQYLPEGAAGSLDMLDLGCGTGLGGLQFRNLASKLVGIDISPQMVEAARQRGIYDELEVRELLDALVRHQDDTDLALAADTFPYIGDLESVFLSVSSVLRPGGLFLFTVETHDEEDNFKLGNTARYSHSNNYIMQLAGRRKFDVLACERTTYRMESGKPVPGLVVALRKPAA